MARLARDTKLETREARARLKVRAEPYWRQIHPGLFVGYRKGKTGGVWWVRTHAEDPASDQVRRASYTKRRLALADDTADSDGENILTFAQAQRLAIAISEGDALPAGKKVTGGYTVTDAMEDYLADYKARGKDWRGAELTLEAHVKGDIGNVVLAKLTAERLRKWLNGLAATDSEDEDTIRKKRATANRVLNTVRAALNFAYRNGRVDSDRAWRIVKPFRGVDLPRVAYLTPPEAKRLLNACEQDFRSLAHGALLTGCRYGELTRMEAGDFDPVTGKIFARFTKSGRPRHVPLSAEGVAFFTRQTAGKKRGELMFPRADGEPWGKAHQHRRIKAACAAAGIEPAVSFHILRHTYGAALAGAGVPLKVIAEALGHADTRITERHYGHISEEYVARQVRANLPSFGFEPDNVARLP